jgi:hypothetical protein
VRVQLICETDGDTLVPALRLPAEGEFLLPQVDGFRLRIEDSGPGVASRGWSEGSPCSFDWWTEDRTGLVNEYPEYVLGADDWRVEVLPESEPRELPVFLYYYAGLDTTWYERVNNSVPIRAWRRPLDSLEWREAVLWAEDLRFYFPNLESLSPLGWDLVPGGLAGSRERQTWETYTDALVLRDSWAVPCTSELLLKTNNFDWALSDTGDTLTGVAPEPGDSYTLLTRKPLRAGLAYRFHTAPPSKSARPPALHVRAVPDPYIAGNAAEAGSGGHRLLFTGLPGRCTLRIYTLAGDWVRTLQHDDPTTDTLEWDLRNADRQHVAYGLYVFHVSEGQGREQTGRFLIIR